MKLRTIILVIALSVGIVAAVNAVGNGQSSSDAKRADIKRMVELSGAGKLGIQAMNQMVKVFKRSQPSVPDTFWKEFMAEVDPNELVEMVIPSYDKHLTHEEVKQLIAFYQSPIGKKLVSVQPQIMQESMVAGQKWGRELGMKVMKKLKEKGYR
ncbi:MAG: DUF2059 domain-containing protein [bacterium]|nr:DUF2059 domain-containing protein [bacterium]